MINLIINRLIILSIMLLGIVSKQNLFAAKAKAEKEKYTVSSDTVKKPGIFIIGENQAQYELIESKYATSLLTVCKDDINRAFRTWMDVLSEIQKFADKTGFELKGAKLWLNVFIAPDGTIDYLAYYLQPASRNIPEKEMKAFLLSFIKNNKIPLKYKTGFSHYGQVAFPILPENISN